MLPPSRRWRWRDSDTTTHFDGVRKPLERVLRAWHNGRVVDLDHGACYRALAQRDARFDGRFFTAVKTTGIYCRPVCPARTPRPENVVFYPTAAAAQEAGYRPCLRCRPETAPDLGAWRGTSNTVSRALALIELGALDGAGDVEGMAGRLGLGERQLRRLFRQHLGASPWRWPRPAACCSRSSSSTRRVCPWWRSRSPRASEACAGFNEAFLELFARAPSELRRLGGDDVATSGTGGELSLLVRYQPPYEWEAMLDFLRRRAIPGLESVADGRYLRAIAIDGAEGAISICPGPGNALRAGIRVSSLSAVPGIVARVRRVFDLAADVRAISAHLAKDRVLAPLVAKRPGLRVPGAWDGFELAVRAVLGQQVTVGAAIRLATRLVSTFGAPMAAPVGGLTHLFPRPEILARADLTKLGMPKRRACTLAAVAAVAVANPEIFASQCGLDESVRRLCAIPGVGEWTAQYIALRQLREPDAFPASDVGIRRALTSREGRRPDVAEVLERAERWRPWRAYAAQHLWAAAA